MIFCITMMIIVIFFLMKKKSKSLKLVKKMLTFYPISNEFDYVEAEGMCMIF